MTDQIDSRALWDIQSVYRQGLECGQFDFGKAHQRGIDYFNPCIVRRKDGLWLITRRASWHTRMDKLGMNDLFAFKLSEDLRPLYGRKVELEKHFEHEHFEDPRVVVHNGKMFISCCNFLRNNFGCTYPHQMISEIDDEWRSVRRCDPVYGNNGNSHHNQKKHEKNWLWFWLNNKPHLLYSSDPFDVVTFDDNFENAKPVPSHSIVRNWGADKVWSFGHIRGGTPPVFHDGEWWSFFHSATPWRFGKRQYHMGAYAFVTSPVFRLTRITTMPLLTASKDEGGMPDKPPCIFPCGTLFEDSTWTIVAGVNDLYCGWFKIDHYEVKERTVEL